MKTTELQFIRGYLIQLEGAYSSIEGLSYYASKNEDMTNKLDNILDNLSDIIEEFSDDARKIEKELISYDKYLLNTVTAYSSGCKNREKVSKENKGVWICNATNDDYCSKEFNRR